MHTIHVAESGNGWFRPDSSDQVLYPSRRTKLTLRLPKHRVEDAAELVGKTLDVGGYELSVNNVSHRQLSAITTLFARYIAFENTADEVEFMQAVYAELGEMGVRPKKMMCGTEKIMTRPDGPLLTRSVMIANLKFEETVKLQQLGIGSHRWMGCGIFMPHKDINEIGETMN
jgi:CRISPR-associated protein Cas6